MNLETKDPGTALAPRPAARGIAHQGGVRGAPDTRPRGSSLEMPGRSTEHCGLHTRYTTWCMPTHRRGSWRCVRLSSVHGDGFQQAQMGWRPGCWLTQAPFATRLPSLHRGSLRLLGPGTALNVGKFLMLSQGWPLVMSPRVPD